MTTKEAAAELGLTVRRVRQLLDAGILAGYMVGRDWNVSASSVRALKARRENHYRRETR